MAFRIEWFIVFFFCLFLHRMQIAYEFEFIPHDIYLLRILDFMVLHMLVRVRNSSEYV